MVKVVLPRVLLPPASFHVIVVLSADVFAVTTILEIAGCVETVMIDVALKPSLPAASLT